MSTELEELTTTNNKHTDVGVTVYYGGADVGRCIQLTQHGQAHDRGIHYVQLDRQQLQQLVQQLKEQQLI